MPDIILPHIPIDGAVSSADGISQNLYDPAAAPNSYEVINGRMDNANREATWDVDTTQIQRNGCSGGGSVGATLGLNYFEDLFRSFDAAVNDPTLYEPIPGSSLEFYLPHDPALTILSWTLHLTGNGVPGSTYDDPPAPPPNIVGRIYLHVDGTRFVAGTTRNMLIPGSTARGLTRTWAGHVMIDGPGLGGTLGKGWHSASLRIVIDPTALKPGVQFSRLNCRAINYVYFS